MKDTRKGRNFIGASVTVTMEIENGDREGLTVDLEPITSYRKLSLQGKHRGSGGQCQDTIREYTETATTTAEEKTTLLRLLDIWDRWHMNDCNAGTRNQRRAIEDHKAEHRDCEDSTRLDHYGHLCAVLRNTAPFSVYCDAELTDSEIANALVGKYQRTRRILATSTIFYTRERADKFASTVPASRHPEVIGLLIDRVTKNERAKHGTAYKYGSAWLIDPLPAEIEAELLDIFSGNPAHRAPEEKPKQITKEEAEFYNLMCELPTPPPGATFKPVGLRVLSLPHPYLITNECFTDSLYLDTEKPCGTCGKPASQHEQQKTLFIEVEQNRNLNAIAGLSEYLQTIKEPAEAAGIQGFAFPNRKAVA